MDNRQSTPIPFERVKLETVAMWHEVHGFIGLMNEYEFCDYRLKIKKERAEGYYVLSEGDKYPIDKNGRIPGGWEFFSFLDERLELLL